MNAFTSWIAAAGLLALTTTSGFAAAAESPVAETSGYRIEDDRILFVYVSDEPAEEVFVVGNFMRWERSRPDWRMTPEEGTGRWLLELPLERVKTEGRSFYEFTFQVDGELVDADTAAPHTIYCAGYGHRYTIPELK